jgi:hypothetical protein
MTRRATTWLAAALTTALIAVAVHRLDRQLPDQTKPQRRRLHVLLLRCDVRHHGRRVRLGEVLREPARLHTGLGRIVSRKTGTVRVGAGAQILNLKFAVRNRSVAQLRSSLRVTLSDPQGLNIVDGTATAAPATT